MAGKSVEAGGAFVRLFLKDDMTKALAKSMKAAGESLTDVGASVMKAGAGISAGGLAILAPITAGIAAYTSMGGAADDAAARTGLTVEALSELGFAAQQTGSNIDEVEVGLKKMAGEIQDFADGGVDATRRFKQLGISLSDLQGLSPDQQFSLIGKAIAGIEDPTMRAAMAVDMFGRSGTQMLPMLKDMDALRAKARELGIVMSTEDAAAADALGDAFDVLKAQAAAFLFQIGSAVGGPLLQFATQASKVGKVVIEWVRDNKGLIVTVAAIGGALTILGGAVTAVGAVIWGAGSVLTLLGTSMAVLLSPIGLVAAALIGGVGAWLAFSDAGNRVLETVQSVIGGISSAITAGDMAGALEIAFAGMELVAAVGSDAIGSLFGETFGNLAGLITTGDFAGAWSLAVDGMALVWESFATGVVNVFTGAATAVIDAWQTATTWITKKIFEMASQGGPVGAALSKVLGVDLGKLQEGNDQRAFEGKRQSILLMEDQLTEAKAAGDAAKVADLEARLQTARDQLGSGQYGGAQVGDIFGDSARLAGEAIASQAQTARDKMAGLRTASEAARQEAANRFVGGNAAASGARSGAADAAQARLDDLLTQRDEARAETESDAILNALFDERDAEDLAAGVATGPAGVAAKQNAFALGPTFSAAAAQAGGFGGGAGPQERTASGIEKMAAKLDAQLALMAQGNATSAGIITAWERFLAAQAYG